MEHWLEWEIDQWVHHEGSIWEWMNECLMTPQHEKQISYWMMQRTTQRENICCYHNMGYYIWLAARNLLYTPCHRQNSTYRNLCGVLAGLRNSSLKGDIPLFSFCKFPPICERCSICFSKRLHNSLVSGSMVLNRSASVNIKKGQAIGIAK